jgi:phosphatidate cytidylyltransferase
MNSIAKRTISALTTAALVVLAIIYASETVITFALGLLLGCVLLEYLLLLGKKMPLASARASLWFLAGVPVLALPFVAFASAVHFHGNLMMLYLIAIVKISDMGGFAAGVSTAKLMKGGNHKMCPTISPNKSWEGLAGSVTASCILSCCFMPITGFIWWKALAFGVTAALVGTFGDLVESKFKRWVGVKDSSTFMPAGMGGFLDMFDSLLFAPAVLLQFI